MKSFKQYLLLAEARQKTPEKVFMSHIIRLLDKNTKITSKSDHLRFQIRGGEKNVEKFFKKQGIAVFPSDLSISGTFKTYILKASKNLGNDVKRGDTVYYVNNVRETASGSEKLFNTKSLSPNEIDTIKFDKDITARQLKSQIKNYWNTQKKVELNPKQKEYMMYLLDQVATIPANGSKRVIPPPFQEEDVAEISKDYGEVLAGMWACTGYENGNGTVNFPSSKAFPIADILVSNLDGGVDLVSVKTKSGSPTSFNGLWSIAKQSGFLSDKKLLSKLTPLEAEITEIVDIILNNKVYDHAIEIAKWLYKNWNTDDGRNFGLDILSKIMKTPVNNLSDEVFEKWLESFEGDVDAIRIALQPFYNAIGKKPSDKEWVHFLTKKQRHKSEKIQSPLAYHLVDWLNTLYSEPLTSLLNTFRNIVQVNVDLDTKGNLSIKVKSFPEIDFIFANAGNSTNSRNKIGFKKAK